MKKRGKLLEDSVQPLPTLAASTAHGAAWRDPSWEIQRRIRIQQFGGAGAHPAGAAPD
jgi:hypothetical protein